MHAISPVQGIVLDISLDTAKITCMLLVLCRVALGTGLDTAKITCMLLVLCRVAVGTGLDS